MDTPPPPSSKPVETWSISELRGFLDSRSVDYSDCLEKSDYVDRARSALQSSAASAAPAAAPEAAPAAEAPPQPQSQPGDQPQPEATGAGPAPAKKANVNYYEVLEVPRDATTQTITKAYYRLARRFHPDKCPDDPQAEERFKLIAEAYQVLTNPERREHYDKFGSVDEEMGDPRELFRMLFGGGAFEEYFPTPLASFVELAACEDPARQEEVMARIDAATKEIREVLKNHLIQRLTSAIETNMTPAQLKSRTAEQMAQLLEAPGGVELVYLVGYVYAQEASQYSSKLLGIPAFFSELKEKGHLVKEAFSALSSAVKAQSLAQEAVEGGEVSQAAVEQGLKTLWKTGKIEIEINVRAVCEDVLGPVLTRKPRSAALLVIGETMKRLATAAKKSGVFSAGPPMTAQ